MFILVIDKKIKKKYFVKEVIIIYKVVLFRFFILEG